MPIQSQHYASESSIITISQTYTANFLPDSWHSHTTFDNFRAIKKAIRNHRPALVIIYIGNEKDEQLGKKVTEYLRQGLANLDTRIVLMREPEFDLDEVSWLEQHQVNACLVAGNNRLSFNLSALNRELDTFIHIDNNQRQHDAETDMLICITQFSKENEKIAELLKKFSASLASLSYSACGFHIKIDDGKQCRISYCDQPELSLTEEFSQLIGLPNIPEYLQHVISEKHPQIDLIPEKIDLTTIEKKLGTTIGSYLTFPIVVYDKVLYLLFYLIPENHMDKVSMKQINIINKASEQLTILLERRQAENSLKKQYQRLEKALIELKSTKQELLQREKMASIGQMAAGIAHEINNPLSYVISNFSSMDNYLESIIKLQDLQSEFLNSVELEQNKNLLQLKQNITEFESEEDIPFVLEDIRAVVSDSFSGLQRVKNIITDLKSFTYSQSTELEICDIEAVIDETIKLLKYELGDDIQVDKIIEHSPKFMAHNGLMGQVFSNLIKNAAQAMREHQTSNPTITLKVSHDKEKALIAVRDNGPGIPQELQQKIFDPFFTTKKIGEGTGLGLSVTFNIIKKLGGEITFESELGKFTEFLIRFQLLH